ncbi:MAG: radical SAM protein, partial [Bacteroidota bacterium]
MNILHVYPKYPDTFWSFRHALKFISKKASFPPLGLLTVAAMLPPHWSQRLVDLNIQNLRDEDLLWADLVFLSAMSVQVDSTREILTRCTMLGRKVVAGGPLFTSHPDEFRTVEHLILNEAELTLPPFLSDLARGTAGTVYRSAQCADVTTTPIPLWHLANLRQYGSMNIQYSRGCPYDCEFCDITVLYGRVPRTKTARQVVAELEALYDCGWRSGVFFVDDNFIGNKRKLKQEILPAITRWMKARKYPFFLNTEASVNLADDSELLELMARAGFDTVFVGIESPNEESLEECRKVPNTGRDLVQSVRRIQSSGLQVQGGFIVGFDHDPPTIFDRLVTFIEETGIVTAMVGLLNAPTGSRLYQRLLREGRLLASMSGDNTDGSMNFSPKMGYDVL